MHGINSAGTDVKVPGWETLTSGGFCCLTDEMSGFVFLLILGLFIHFSSHFLLKPLDTFGTEFFFFIHRFTNNLQGLQKVMVKDFS